MYTSFILMQLKTNSVASIFSLQSAEVITEIIAVWMMGDFKIKGSSIFFIFLLQGCITEKVVFPICCSEKLIISNVYGLLISHTSELFFYIGV